MHSVLKKASWGTRGVFGGTLCKKQASRCKKQASGVRRRYSVPEPPFSGTEWSNQMRALRSGLWLEDATTVGVVPAAGTTLLLLPMGPVLTASWERLSGYNATAADPEKRPSLRSLPTTRRTWRTSTLRETPLPAGGRHQLKTPRHQLKKSTARNTPNPKTHYHHPKNTPLPRVPRQRRELQ